MLALEYIQLQHLSDIFGIKLMLSHSMGSNQFFGYTSTPPSIPLMPNQPLGSLKFEFGNSPNSPFSTQFDSDSFTTLSDTQDHYSPSENLSKFSISYSSSQICSGGSSFSNCHGSIDDALQELETALMGSDADEDEVTTQSPSFSGNKRTQLVGARPTRPHGAQSHLITAQKRQKGSERGEPSLFPPNNLKQLLIACGQALSENRKNDFEKLIQEARGAVSISGEPIQRLGAYMVEGLVARKEASGSNIYRTLKCREPESKDLLSYMHLLYEICPYLKFGYMAANGAIAEACRSEDRIHIIDFQIAQGTQWVTLLQALAARPGGPPHVRITGIDDPVSKYARGGSLEAVGKRLAGLSEKFKIPVEFHAIPVFAPEVTRKMLQVKPGEAIAVNFPLQLHHTPDESVDVNNPRDGLLRMVKSLSPKVTTLVEQESNTNTTPFFTRFLETLDFYSAMFESIDVTMPRDRKERINVEMHCLARDIVNIIACEGKERVERHELFGKWKSRFMMAGFRQYPLSSYVNSVISSLLRCYSEHYTLRQKDGAMLLGWKDRNLISASAWN